MKLSVGIALFVFWTVATALLVASFVVSEIHKAPFAVTSASGGGSAPLTAQNVVSGAASAVAPADAQPGLTLAELAKHDSAQNCWLLIAGKIYDVTTFLPDHPGEARTILPTCGTDATQAFADRGGTGTHSNIAKTMLAAYYIGDLGVNTPAPAAKPPAAPRIGTQTKPAPTPSALPNAVPSPSFAPPVPVPAPATPPPAPPAVQISLTMNELAQHASAQSCWLLISGKVYDVTNFLNMHPGNASTILPSCGKEATQAFADRGGTGTHSNIAKTMLAAYYIGDLNQTVQQSPTQTTPAPAPAPAPTQIPRGGDDEWEDD